MAGYHMADIPKGQVGTAAKIEEEFLEFKDALTQNNRLMVLQELSDMIGAVEHYLLVEFDNQIRLEDLLIMAEATRRAFATGHRR